MTAKPRYSPLTPSGFGAELGDLDLARLDEAMVDGAMDAFHEAGGLIVLRDQGHIDPADLQRFVNRFGYAGRKREIRSGLPGPGIPRHTAHRQCKGKRPVHLALHPGGPAAAAVAHGRFLPPSPAGRILPVLPPHAAGGRGDGLRGDDRGLRGPAGRRQSTHRVHPDRPFLQSSQRTAQEEEPAPSAARRGAPRAVFPPIVRPLVARHPETGRKSLYLPLCHIESVEGLGKAEGEALLKGLQEHATGAAYTYMHRWRPGDLVVWDNRCTLHAPTPFDDSRHERLMYRLTFGGRQIAGF